MPSHCRGCGAAIRWVWTQNGKKHPLDWTPDGPKANIRVDEDDVMEILGPLELTIHDGVLWTSHWATCPNADDFRKGSG